MKGFNNIADRRNHSSANCIAARYARNFVSQMNECIASNKVEWRLHARPQCRVLSGTMMNEQNKTSVQVIWTWHCLTHTQLGLSRNELCRTVSHINEPQGRNIQLSETVERIHLNIFEDQWYTKHANVHSFTGTYHTGTWVHTSRYSVLLGPFTPVLRYSMTCVAGTQYHRNLRDQYSAIFLFCCFLTTRQHKHVILWRAGRGRKTVIYLIIKVSTMPILRYTEIHDTGTLMYHWDAIYSQITWT